MYLLLFFFYGIAHTRDRTVLTHSCPSRRASALDVVFQPGVFAVDATAVVALGVDHGLGHGDHLVRRDETDDVGQARIGCRIAMGGAHTAAAADVVAA